MGNYNCSSGEGRSIKNKQRCKFLTGVDRIYFNGVNYEFDTDDLCFKVETSLPDCPIKFELTFKFMKKFNREEYVVELVEYSFISGLLDFILNEPPLRLNDTYMIRIRDMLEQKYKLKIGSCFNIVRKKNVLIIDY